MNRLYIHIKHLVDNKDQVKNNRQQQEWQVDKQDTNQLNGKQHHWHIRFNCYEYDMLKFGTPVEPKVHLTEVGLSSKNTLRILNTIKPVTMIFAAIDTTMPIRATMFHQVGIKFESCRNVLAPPPASDPTSQVARGDKLKSA